MIAKLLMLPDLTAEDVTHIQQELQKNIPLIDISVVKQEEGWFMVFEISDITAPTNLNRVFQLGVNMGALAMSMVRVDELLKEYKKKEGESNG